MGTLNQNSQTLFCGIEIQFVFATKKRFENLRMGEVYQIWGKKLGKWAPGPCSAELTPSEGEAPELVSLVSISRLVVMK